MKPFYTILITLLLLSPAFSQISVTSNSLTSWIGFTQVIQADTSGNISVNVGMPGANQIWDFSAMALQSTYAEYELFTASSTPYAADFPDANYAYKISLDLGAISGTAYQYVNLNSDRLKSLGNVLVSQGTVVSRDQDTEITPLPLSFGSSWQSTTADTFESPGVSINITKTTEMNTIDGWGTIKLPSGEYNCLRWKTVGTTEEVAIFNGVEISLGSSSYIEYTWIGQNSLLLATVTSLDDETNPNFSTASDVSWLSELKGSTQIIADSESPDEFQLYGNYPNPFNPSTTISFNLPETDFLFLRIYDVNGSLVQDFMQQASAGLNQLKWDGTNMNGQPVAAGTYLYELRSASFRAVNKMTFLK